MKKYLSALVILILVIVLGVGCAVVTPAPTTSPTSQPSSTATPTTTTVAGKGTIEVRVMDPPVPQVDHAWVDVQNLSVHKDGGSWETIAVNTEPFDLKAIEGIEQFLASKLVETGKYTQIRLEVKSVKIVTGTEEHYATVPSGEIKLIGNFEVAEGQTTAITIDFDGEKSVVVTGNGKYNFKPVIKLLIAKPEKGGIDIITPRLPNGGAGTAYSATVEAKGGITPYAWSISDSALPAGLTLDSATGVISGMPTTAGNYEFTVKVEDKSSPPKNDTQKYNLEIAAQGALIIATTSLPDGKIGTAYTATISAIGGTAPYKWSVSASTVPAGLTLNADTGVISGIPTNKGNQEFTVKVEDTSTPVQNDIQQVSITIGAPDELAITTATLAEGTVGAAYSAILEATGGITPYTWSIATGTLPAGLTLDGATGIISSTPATAGTSNFTVKVEDKSTPVQNKTQELSITISTGT